MILFVFNFVNVKCMVLKSWPSVVTVQEVDLKLDNGGVIKHDGNDHLGTNCVDTSSAMHEEALIREVIKAEGEEYKEGVDHAK